MIVRDARLEDLPGVLAIYNEVVAHSTAVFSAEPASLAERRAWFEARRARGFPVLVAAEGDEVVGFGSFGDFRGWPGYRHTVEHSVHVREGRRGGGVGGRLLGELVARAEALGKHVIVAGVDAANGPSLRLHERFGFERAAHLRQVGCKFGRWLDLVLLQKTLNDAPAPPDGG